MKRRFELADYLAPRPPLSPGQQRSRFIASGGGYFRGSVDSINDAIDGLAMAEISLPPDYARAGQIAEVIRRLTAITLELAEIQAALPDEV